jgi:hypothetical protein
MPCNTHHANIERLTDGHLDAAQIADLKHRLESEQCNECLEILENHLLLSELSHDWQEQEMPEWNRTQHIIKPIQKERHWTNFASIALSTMAIVLVLSQFQIHTTDHGILFSFAGQGQERIIEQRVESTLKRIQSQQKEYIDAKLVNFNNEQAAKNLQLINAVVELNRTERRQEMVKFVHFLDNKEQLSGSLQNTNNAVNYQAIDLEALDLEARDLEPLSLEPIEELNDSDLLTPKGTN